jgi:hypothetical protein
VVAGVVVAAAVTSTTPLIPAPQCGIHLYGNVPTCEKT